MAAAASDQVIAVVLAGGQSRRMGSDKALLTIDGSAMLERTVRVLQKAGVARIALSVSTPERAAALLAAAPALAALPMVYDTAPGSGPLSALADALRAYRDRSVLLVACDMPDLDPFALRPILELPADADAIVPCPHGRPEPLHALYRPDCLAVAEQLCATNHLAMRDLLEALVPRVYYLDDAWLAGHGIAPRVFANVNTPADLATSGWHDA